MTARQTAAGLLMAVAVAAAPAAQASPIREEPGTGSLRETRTAALLHQLRIEFADTHQRGTHNEIVLVLNDPASAFL